MTLTRGAGTDSELLADATRGDGRAFAAVYARHAPSLLHFTEAIIVDHALAEDVVQEVFLYIWNNPARFDSSRSSLRSWLRTLAHRRAVDKIRSVAASHQRDHTMGLRELTTASHETDRWDALFSRQQLADSLRRLTVKQRDAVMLRYLGEQSTAEVAATLGVHTDAAKSRIFDGIAALRIMFREQT